MPVRASTAVAPLPGRGCPRQAAFSGKAGQQQRDRTSIPSPCSSYPIGDNLSDVAACTGAQKGRHSGNAGLFGPRYEQEADEMKRDLRVLATASALLLSMGTASAQKQGGILKNAILTVQRACRCSRNRRSQPTGR